MCSVRDEDRWQCYFSVLWLRLGTPKVQTMPSKLTFYSLHRFRSQCSKLSLLDAYLLSSRRPLIGECKQIMQGALETWSLILSASEDFQES